MYVPAVKRVLWLRWRGYIVFGNEIKALAQEVTMKMLFLVYSLHQVIHPTHLTSTITWTRSLHDVTNMINLNYKTKIL